MSNVMWCVCESVQCHAMLFQSTVRGDCRSSVLHCWWSALILPVSTYCESHQHPAATAADQHLHKRLCSSSIHDCHSTYV